MAFLENTWYAAAWSGEVGRQLLPRTFLNQPVVLYRKENGAIAALADRCPHRFVPLHLGKLKGDIVECGYHGLCFKDTGECSFNPHGDGAIPKAARVKSYKVAERHGVVWIWMGDADLADESKIHDFGQFGDSERYASVFGYLHVAANYQLITDNLLDLTHGQYIHPLFANPAGPSTMEPNPPYDENTVWAKFIRRNQYPNKYFEMLGYPGDRRGDHRNYMRWNPPALLLLDVGMTGVGEPHDKGISIPTAHLLTPETESTTHYFWGMARDFRRDDTALGEILLQIGTNVFDNEDKPIIEAQQRSMGSTTELLALKPVLLQTDAPAVRARRILGELIQNEEHGKQAASNVAS
ncbi:Toluene-4-sulfonate monooxygenase system iron-sulfur subunit TsaM1 [Pandoraea terrae]|uniref:Toluene-4-sulfonate monooxygenase system iron-sulfur subunit TsaM1 n=1 Tax=Pandoraea terrae TaxID=1537710 RepID=A0A5E4XQ69_9BURK|nr:aromatic ring-hydroxylating dioxygenase subunit alpha [Pandoraea terrae]VVE38470.1 Toluene-4-sulfonate monooxygenase system iron-sulfur subunit TsaM1 [Pandoraea terrae]